MLLGFTVTNPLGEELYLSLSNPEQSGLVVRNIDGIGSPNSSINMTEYATIDGSRYNTARAIDRTITIQLDYMWAPDPEHARRKAYRYFPVKGKVKLVFKTDYPIEYSTVGYVESNSPSIFSQKSGCTISIRCPDPYFHSVNPQVTNFYSVQPLFEFPFESRFEPDEDFIEFGSIRQNLVSDIYYDGDQPVGFAMTINISGDGVGDIKVTNATSYDSMTISSERVENMTGYPIQSGDQIILQTVKGSKMLILKRNSGADILNILGAIDEYTAWLLLNPGYNTFLIESTDHAEFVSVVIQNDVLYEGI